MELERKGVYGLSDIFPQMDEEQQPKNWREVRNLLQDQKDEDWNSLRQEFYMMFFRALKKAVINFGNKPMDGTIRYSLRSFSFRSRSINPQTSRSSFREYRHYFLRSELIVVMQPSPGLVILDDELTKIYPVVEELFPKESRATSNSRLIQIIRQYMERELYTSDIREYKPKAESDTNTLLDLVLNTITSENPHIAFVKKPKMEFTLQPAWKADSTKDECTVGVLALDNNNKIVATTALHGTNGVGTAVDIEGDTSIVAYGCNILDAAIIPTIKNDPTRFLFPKKSSPGMQDEVTFCGLTSGLQHTVITGMNQEVPNTPPATQVKVYTDPRLNLGDSGAALVSENGEVIGFAFQRTDPTQPGLQYDSWIWAKSVFNQFNLNY